MGVTITMAGQDITNWVDELTLDIESNLGQGPGVPQGASGRATTCKFLARMGPQGGALGSGEAIPTRNFLPAAQADCESSTAPFSTYLGASGGASLTTTGPWQGHFCMKCVSDGSGTYQYVCNSIPIYSFQPNETYTFSVYMRGALGGEKLRFYTQANQNLSGNTSVGTVTTYTLTTSWVRYTVTVTMPSSLSYDGYDWTIMGLRVDTGSPAEAQTWYMDGFQFQSGGATAWMEGGSAPQLVRQGEVIIYDSSGDRIFGGYATDLQDKTEFTQVKTQVTCSDYWQDLARVIVNQIYSSEYDDQIISQLFAGYKPDIDLSSWVPSHTYLFTKIYLRAKTLQDSLQMIADTTGFDIWINPYKKFQYISPTDSGTAPFAVSDDPNFSSSFPLAVTKYEKDDTAIINRVYFYGGKTPSDDYTQDLSPQANGSNNTFVLAYYPRPSSDGNVDLYIGGVLMAMGAAFGTGAANTLIQDGGTAQALLNSSAQAITVDSSVIPAAGTGVISCKYRYEIPLTVMVTNQQSYQFFGRWFDGTISDTTVQDKNTAIQRARILLQEQAYGFEHITLHCWKAGLAAGQLLRIDHNVRNIHNAYIVQSVKVQPLGNGTFQYEVDLGAWNWNLVDVMMQAAKGAGLIDQLDDETQDVVTATQVQASIGVHFSWSNELRTAGGYYARSTPVGDGHDAYPGLFTVTT
jgi:hypothetical protein